MTFHRNKNNISLLFFSLSRSFLYQSSMSFHYNRKTSSPPFSPALLDDLYDSQQLDTLVNQTRTFTSPPRKRQTSKNKMATSYMSILDDLDDTSVLSTRVSPSIERPTSSAAGSVLHDLKESVFAFIDPQGKVKFFYVYFLPIG